MLADLRGPNGRPTNDELAGQADDAALSLSTRGEHPVAQLASDVNAGKMRACLDYEEVPVVEAYDRDVVGYPTPALAQRLDGAARDLVVPAEEAVDVGVEIEQTIRRHVAPACAPLSTRTRFRRELKMSRKREIVLDAAQSA